jgi:small subunit ribosomal protein S20
MANMKSAKKRAKQNEVRRTINVARRTSIKTAIKKVLVAIETKENSQTVQELFQDAQAKIARAKGKGLFHKNTAARKISRLAKRVAVATGTHASR